MTTWKTYVVTMKHDGGTVKIGTRATSIEGAVESVLTAEKAPLRAVKSCKVITDGRKSVIIKGHDVAQYLRLRAEGFVTDWSGEGVIHMTKARGAE